MNMNFRNISFIVPGARPYIRTMLTYFVFDRYIRTPAVGLNLLTTIVKREFDDTYMYSEAISKIPRADVVDADIIVIGSVFTFNANRAYQLARFFKKHTHAIVIIGGLHVSMNYREAVRYGDYVLLGEG